MLSPRTDISLKLYPW